MEVFHEGGRVTETADTSLDHLCQILPEDVFCAQVSVSYISATAQHSLPHIQHKVEGHYICFHRHRTPCVSSAPLANLFLPPCLLE